MSSTIVYIRFLSVPFCFAELYPYGSYTNESVCCRLLCTRSVLAFTGKASGRRNRRNGPRNGPRNGSGSQARTTSPIIWARVRGKVRNYLTWSLPLRKLYPVSTDFVFSFLLAGDFYPPIGTQFFIKPGVNESSLWWAHRENIEISL